MEKRIIRGLNFVQTCSACPEQYDVFNYDNQIVGYVRLRWCGLTCEYPDCGGEVIYSANIGDGWSGCFENDDQRYECLRNIADAILDHINALQKPPIKKVFCFDNFNNGVFGSWHEGMCYDVVRYDEENEEWYIKDEFGSDGIVDVDDFDKYFEEVDNNEN